MGTTTGNFAAQKNGRMIETLIFGKQISSHHILDSPKLEVKTAQEFVKNKDRKSGKQVGRFVLYHHQHELLLKNKGKYLFCILGPLGTCIAKRKISAKKIEEAFGILGRPQVTLLHTTVFGLPR